MTPALLRWLPALVLAGTVTAQAQTATDTAAPDYYVEALFAVTTAEQLATFCPTVTVDLEAANDAAEALLVRLAGDGIAGDALTALTGVEPRVALLQDAFITQYGLDQPSEAKLCGAARDEIAAQSAIGAYLVEVSN